MRKPGRWLAAALLLFLHVGCVRQPHGMGELAPVRELPTALQTAVTGAPIELPPPGGPHRVGRASYHAVDPTRGEPFTPDTTDHREVVFHVWYPAAAEGRERAAFIDVSPQDSVFRRSYSFMGVETLPRVRSHAYADVALSHVARRYPVILFSHGLGAVAKLYTSFLENLASHGYIVVGVDHPYFSAAFTLPDGRTVRNLSRPEFRQRDVVTQAQDLVFVLDLLERIDRDPTSRFAHRLDLRNVGVFGQSRGGFAAPHACRLDRRFRACANLDGYSLTPQVMEGGIVQPYMHIEESAPWDPPPSDSELVRAGQTRQRALAEAATDSAIRDRTFHRMTAGAYLVVVAGAVHASFSNQPFIAPERYPGVALDFGRTLQITDAYLLAFFNRHLRGTAEPLLERRPPPYPEVSVTHYQPNGMRQVFRGAR
jgi:hypothetical protein